MKNFLVSFLFGTVLFTLIADGLSALFWENFQNWLQTYLNIDKVLLRELIVIFLIVFILFLIYGTKIPLWYKNITRKFFGRVPPQPNTVPLINTFPGLIAAMSPKDDSPAEVVIKHHWNGGKEPHLKHCWLICTNKSLPYANTMIKNFTDENMTQKVKFYYGNYELEDLENTGQKLSLLLKDDVIDDREQVSFDRTKKLYLLDKQKVV